MKYLALIFLSLLWIIHFPNPANAGATRLQYDYHYNAVESLEKTPNSKNKLTEWAKQKRLAFKPKLRLKKKRFDISDEVYSDAYVVIGLIAWILSLVFLGIALKIALIWVIWLAIGLFSIFLSMSIVLIMVAFKLESKRVIEKIMSSFIAEASILVSFYLALIFFVFLFIVGLILGFVWVWIAALSLLLVTVLCFAYFW